MAKRPAAAFEEDVEQAVQLIRTAWRQLLRGIEKSSTHYLYHLYVSESDLRCLLFHECLKLLKLCEQKGLLFTEYKIDNKRVDLAFHLLVPAERELIIAIEIKHDPKPAKIEKDLKKLHELIEEGAVVRGVFLTLASSDYRLKERLERQGVFRRFKVRSVEWHSFKRRIDGKNIDALFVVL